jgi:hypothetical protein
MVRDEDYRSGSGGGRISSDGFSKPLGNGERRALAQQHENRRLSEGLAAEVVARQAAKPVDMALKAPRRISYGG